MPMNSWKGCILEQNHLRLIKYPNPVLYQRSEICTQECVQDIIQKVPEMSKIMNNMNGIGLAAVQVGILKRFAILKDSQGKIHTIINPVLVNGDDLTSKREGCLSLPFFYENIDRFEEVTVTFRDETWAEKTAVFRGLEAQCIQHEINHMSGILIFDTVSKQKQDMWIKKAKKKGVL